MSTIARYYDASKYDGGHLPGVPLDDLTDEVFDALPEWLQRSVDASPLYRKSKPSGGDKPAAHTPKPEKET